MFKNHVFKLTTAKVVSAPLIPSSLLPGTLFLIGGLVIWRLWHKQAKLQVQTSDLSDELKGMKKQITKIKEKSESKTMSGSAAPLADSLKKSVGPLSSSLKKSVALSSSSLKKSVAPLSSSLKKVSDINFPWSSNKGDAKK